MQGKTANNENPDSHIENEQSRLRIVRNALGVSIQELAFALGVSPGTIQGWETSRQEQPTIAILLKLRAFGINDGFILGHDELMLVQGKRFSQVKANIAREAKQ